MFLGGTMQMTPDNWDRAKELFEAALELDSSQRMAFLAENCREESLRQQVETLQVCLGFGFRSPVRTRRFPVR